MREEKINQIEDILSTVIYKLSTQDYLELISSNKSLKKYDEISGKIDNGDYPPNYLDKLDDMVLDEIIIYLIEKTTNII